VTLVNDERVAHREVRNPFLEVSQLSVWFGGVGAVKNVDLVVGEGEVVGLIGPNGAGKTTFLDGVSGMVPATGQVLLKGRDISKLAPFRRVRAGLARTFQRGDALRDLTTGQLVELSVAACKGERSPLLDDVLQRLEFDRFADRSLSELPAGSRRLVSVAAAVATNPQVLMLDEPAAGLSTDEAMELSEVVRFLGASGLGVLVIDHNVGFVARTTDYIYMLHLGNLEFAGTPEEMRSSETVKSIYLGSGVDDE